jgi:hypothetical protein
VPIGGPGSWGRTVVEASEHREDVIGRLLDRGLSPAALRALFPGWGELIDRLSAERTGPADGVPHAPPRSDG